MERIKSQGENTEYRNKTQIGRCRLMFMGEFNHSIDAKGRIIVPAKFREDLGEEFVVTLGLDGCLFLYPDSEWREFVEQLKHLPGNRQARQLQRYFLAGATTCEIDKQGRITIDTGLLRRVGITKDIVLVGNGYKLLIWDAEKYEEKQRSIDTKRLAASVSRFGLNI